MREYIRANNEKENTIVSLLILNLIPLSFVLFDWQIGLFTFGDYIFGFTVGLLIVSRKVYLKRKDIIFILSTALYVFLNVMLNEIYNVYFYFPAGRAALVKISFYLFFILLTYRYIRHVKIEERLLKFINVYALLTLLIGIYIVIAVCTETLPFQFIWTFTRQDKASYIFRETVRMRSVFSEPAHLGFFFNTVIGLNVFSKYSNKISPLFTLSFIVGSILTFSYSSIAITGFIVLLVGLRKLIKERKEILNIKTLLYVIIVLLVIYASRDFLYRTVYLRTLQILSGEDGSAFNRIFESWLYATNNLWIGNGAGNTPPITNNFAYMLSDLGIVAFLFSIGFTFVLTMTNFGLGIVFILLNFQKGGYLSPSFSLLCLFVLLYGPILTGKVKEKFQKIKARNKTNLL